MGRAIEQDQWCVILTHPARFLSILTRFVITHRINEFTHAKLYYEFLLLEELLSECPSFPSRFYVAISSPFAPHSGLLPPLPPSSLTSSPSPPFLILCPSLTLSYLHPLLLTNTNPPFLSSWPRSKLLFQPSHPPRRTSRTPISFSPSLSQLTFPLPH